MKKYFNITGPCNRERHYMVNIDKRLQETKALVDNGDYFVINRARQYGKTTILKNLKTFLSEEYFVFSISFEGFTGDVFQSENVFCQRVFKLLYTSMIYGNSGMIPEAIVEECRDMFTDKKNDVDLWTLSDFISRLCQQLAKPAVLLVDEVDQASNQQIFLAFLGTLRDQYINRSDRPAFQSVVLAGVYDIKNLKLRIRSEQEHQYNSPWNIAAKFDIDMSFTPDDIRGMLEEYAADRELSFDYDAVSGLIYDYTCGYPFLVSAICKNIDEQILPLHPEYAWGQEGIMESIHLLLKYPNTLFDDMIKHLTEYPDLANILQNILFEGQEYPFNAYAKVFNVGIMFGFLKDSHGQVAVSNKIFETHLYNYFLAEEIASNSAERMAVSDRNQFIEHGHLNMRMVMDKFVQYYSDIYSNSDNIFVEKYGRKIFLLYLKPIINGTGNFYIEAQTRDLTRTDVIIDYAGEQFIIELKIWRGETYQKQGEQQLFQYLEFYHKNTGYLLTFNFNKHKETGMREIIFKDKILLEYMV